jgi:hypothetical protein
LTVYLDASAVFSQIIDDAFSLLADPFLRANRPMMIVC